MYIFLILLIVLKTIADLLAHTKEHKPKYLVPQNQSIYIQNINPTYQKIGVILSIFPTTILLIILFIFGRFVFNSITYYWNHTLPVEVTSDGDNIADANTNTYKNAEFFIEFQYPKDWKVLESKGSIYQEGFHTFLKINAIETNDHFGFDIYLNETDLCNDNNMSLIKYENANFLNQPAKKISSNLGNTNYTDYYILSKKYCYVYSLFYNSQNQMEIIENILGESIR